jgi:hypothetical protein
VNIFIGMETSDERRRFQALGHYVLSVDVLPAEDRCHRIVLRSGLFLVYVDTEAGHGFYGLFLDQSEPDFYRGKFIIELLDTVCALVRDDVQIPVECCYSHRHFSDRFQYISIHISHCIDCVFQAAGNVEGENGAREHLYLGGPLQSLNLPQTQHCGIGQLGNIAYKQKPEVLRPSAQLRAFDAPVFLGGQARCFYRDPQSYSRSYCLCPSCQPTMGVSRLNNSSVPTCIAGKQNHNCEN